MPLERLKDFPRASLWPDPTPLESQHNLASALGVHSFHIKRDDCNGLAFGGNKVRQMEYYLGDALAKGADALLITGAVQSNFVRTAAAACAKCRVECHVQLENRVAKKSQNYTQSGNVLLDHLLGATVYSFPKGEDEEGADRNLEAIAENLRDQGKTPYVVHLHPAHPPLGALGYVDAAVELVKQLETLAEQPDVIFVPSGSGNTHGGLLYGLRAMGCDIPVEGVCVRRSAEQQKPRITERLNQIAELLEESSVAVATDVSLTDSFLAPGYGVAGPETKMAISLLARQEGLILDPVYTGKAMAAAIAWGRQHTDSRILFVHTGGGPSIFAYDEDMMNAAKQY
ncbi:MAG: D-cysteine desulfhydrase family protein [Pseudomonadota bacterium]